MRSCTYLEIFVVVYWPCRQGPAHTHYLHVFSTLVSGRLLTLINNHVNALFSIDNFVKPNALWQISRSCTSFFKVSCKEVFYSPFSTYFVTNLLQKILTRRLLSHYSLTSSNPTLYADSISFVCAFAQYPKEHRTIAPHKGD